jgi:hypothetical protein
VVKVGSKMVRAVWVLGILLGIWAEGTAAAGDNGQLFQRQPERLLIESARRISDGRKLQQEADTNFRRVEGGAGGGSGEGGLSSAGQGAGSSGTRAASSAESAESAERR